ncbi:MAG: TPM domain-containing protein [Clostridia bacterium]|nr:TPM domain-containing protein [Clostridia bacterium]
MVMRRIPLPMSPRILLFFVLISALFLFFNPVLAEKVLVIDEAGSFTSGEIETLTSEAKSLGSLYAMDLVILTIQDANGKSSRDYADDFFDYGGYGVGEDRSGILFLIDYDNREIYISTSGAAIRYLTDQRIESILDEAQSHLENQDPYGAALAFLAKTADFLAAGIPSGQYAEEEREHKLTQTDGLVSLVLSGSTGLLFFYLTRRKYRGKRVQPVFEFRRNSIANLGLIEDLPVRTYVTSRMLAKSQSSGSSSSRSTVHHSSSGRTHGGGGRKF